MGIVSAALVMSMLFGVTASAKPMGLDKSDEIMALGKILKVDKEVLNMDQRVGADHQFHRRRAYDRPQTYGGHHVKGVFFKKENTRCKQYGYDQNPGHI